MQNLLSMSRGKRECMFFFNGFESGRKNMIFYINKEICALGRIIVFYPNIFVHVFYYTIYKIKYFINLFNTFKNI